MYRERERKRKPMMNRIQRFNPPVAMACFFALVFALVAPSPALARKKNDQSISWDNVLKLKTGDRVIVTTFSKKVYHGRVAKVEPGSIGISLEKHQSPLLIPKEQVQIVALDRIRSAVLTGTILAAAGGAIILGGNIKANNDFTNCFNNAEQKIQTSAPGTTYTCSSKNNLLIPGIAVAGAGAAYFIFGHAPRFLYQVDAPPAAPAQ
jgi:hypothetical protein